MFFQIVASLLIASIAKLSQAQPWLDSLFAGLGTIILNEFIIWKHFSTFRKFKFKIKIFITIHKIVSVYFDPP